MLNEGVVLNDSKIHVKSTIIRSIRASGPTTPDLLEQDVFKAITGGGRSDVDWDIEDNQAGYFLWLKSFDAMIAELVEDGFILVENSEGGKTLKPAETDQGFHASQAIH